MTCFLKYTCTTCVHHNIYNVYLFINKIDLKKIVIYKMTLNLLFTMTLLMYMYQYL